MTFDPDHLATLNEAATPGEWDGEGLWLTAGRDAPRPTYIADIFVRSRAWELHRANGHPEGYEGPCWGPLPSEMNQARIELKGGRDGISES